MDLYNCFIEPVNEFRRDIGREDRQLELALSGNLPCQVHHLDKIIGSVHLGSDLVALAFNGHPNQAQWLSRIPERMEVLAGAEIDLLLHTAHRCPADLRLAWARQ